MRSQHEPFKADIMDVLLATDIFLIDTYLNIYSVSHTLQFAACLICSYRTYSFSSWNALDRFYDIILFILHIA